MDERTRYIHYTFCETKHLFFEQLKVKQNENVEIYINGKICEDIYIMQLEMRKLLTALIYTYNKF